MNIIVTKSNNTNGKVEIKRWRRMSCWVSELKEEEKQMLGSKYRKGSGFIDLKNSHS